MEKEIIQLFSDFGIDIKNIDTQMKTCINIDATGRRKVIEDLAYDLDIEVEDSKTQFMTAVECISLVGSVITIIDFLLKMKKKYGRSLMVGIKSNIVKKNINVTVDNAIESIIKKQAKNDEKLEQNH